MIENPDPPRKLGIHQSLVRDNLLMGGERVPVLLAAGIGALPMATGRLSLMVVGLAFWLASVWALRHLAKFDPQLSSVIMRHFDYQKFYPAQPLFCAPTLPTKVHQRR